MTGRCPDVPRVRSAARRRRPGDRARPDGDRRPAAGAPAPARVGARRRAAAGRRRAAGRRARPRSCPTAPGRTRTGRPRSAPRSPPRSPPTARSSRPSRRPATRAPPYARPSRVRYRNPTPAGLQVLLELQARPAVRRARRAHRARAARSSRPSGTPTPRPGRRRPRVGARRRRGRARAGRRPRATSRPTGCARLQDEAAAAEGELLAAVERLRVAQEADARARAPRAGAPAARAGSAAAAAARRGRTSAPALRRPPRCRSRHGRQRAAAWTGPVQAPNGLLPDAALCPLATAPGHRLCPPPPRAYDALSRATPADTGSRCASPTPTAATPRRCDVFRRKPGAGRRARHLATTAGAARSTCAAGSSSSAATAHRWMQAHAPAFGWTHPAWAEPGGSRPEPWHWEHAGQSAHASRACPP